MQISFKGHEMSDIFLSYKREDKDKAKIIVEALEQNKYSVWWDPNIIPGDKYRAVIQKELDAAKCVVVLWSSKSILSPWVIDEAEKGINRGIYIPIKIENVEMPMGHGGTQAANLVDWKGPQDEEFGVLLKAISNKVDPSLSSEKKNLKPDKKEDNNFNKENDLISQSNNNSGNPEPPQQKEPEKVILTKNSSRIGNAISIIIVFLLVIGFIYNQIIPSLSVSHESFLKKDSIFLEENAESQFKLSISNGTQATLNWNVKADRSWLTMNKISGSDKSDVIITIKTSGLAIGNHKGNITITSNGGTWIKEINLTVLPFNLSPTIPKNLTLGVNKEWDLERGYSLTPVSIYPEENPKSVLLVLSRNGNKLEEKLLYEGDTYVYKSGKNIFRATITEIFSLNELDMVTIRDVIIS